jgi:regulatory protein
MQDAAKSPSRPPALRQRRGPAPDTPPGPAPDAGRLRDAALAHLARFASTEAGLVRVLDRRILRWSRRALASGDAPEQVEAQAAAARLAVRTVASGLVGAGVVDDAAYAESRARSLTRGGRSRRAIEAHLAQHGVAPELVEAALPEDRDAELGAALMQARRRRIGPFGEEGALDDPVMRNKALAMLARAGFSRDVAERALGLDREEAEQRVIAIRRG